MHAASAVAADPALAAVAAQLGLGEPKPLPVCEAVLGLTAAAFLTAIMADWLLPNPLKLFWESLSPQ